jgi:predicted DNA-binding transcriptional regulator AlpA
MLPLSRDCAHLTESAMRRVYAKELKARTGYGDTWLRELERRGKIPPSRRDPDGKRKWWLDSEVDAIVAGTSASAESAEAA